MTGWRAYYVGGLTFSSEEDEWADLPDDGLLVVVIYTERESLDGDIHVHRRIRAGFDWYFHVPDSDLYAANNDEPDEIRKRYPGAILKRGKWAGEEEYRTVYETAEASEPPEE